MARIQVSKDPSGRIIVSFPYDPVLVSKIKIVDGRRWHPTEKHWSFPKLDHLPSHRWDREAEGVEKSESQLSPPHGKTTEIYAPGSTQGIGKMRSSSDSLNLKEGVVSDNIS